MKLRICLGLFALLLWASAAQAGLVIHQETMGGPSTMYAQDNQVRAGMGRGGMIYDLNHDTVTMLNPDRQVYWSGNPNTLKQQMNQAMDSRIEAALKQVPPDQREQMRAMMKQRMGMTKTPPQPPDKVEVKKTGESAKIAGYQSQKYQVYVDGKLRQEVWMASAPGFKGQVDLTKMTKLAQAMNPQSAAPGSSWRNSPEMTKLMSAGMPMKMVEYSRGGPMTVMTVTSVEQKKLPASTFQPPAGWKQVDFNQMMQ
ncbi:DUF4412 domain-containing protein [Desulfoferula mesophila]|uniref:DUF4412 domain-containing protein n=1 Tax=Desulfoferula mesophila TaxID=3058419 RepID=A0AAU9EP81_9BACT|nr:hypothetical protein FAK_38950 [Desulfoferula mesophilus]